MNARLTRAQFLAGAATALAALPALAAPAKPDPAEATMKKMIEAIRNHSYETFVADGDDTLRAKLTRQQFDGVCGMVAPRLQQGYRTTFLGKLRQQGFETFLWKLEPGDNGDEHLIKLSLKDGKVGGFWIQ